MRHDPDRVLRSASLAAFVLLGTLCLMTAIGGVSQQRFEWVLAPDVYAAELRASACWLRAIIAVDDLFIAAYVIATLALARRLAGPRWDALTVAIAAAGAGAGVLDLFENPDLLAMLRWVERGGALGADEILARSDWSQLKWMLGHVAFAAVGWMWPSRETLLDRVLVASLIGFQLPLGALVWTLDDATWIQIATWVRYASFLSGFGVIAWMSRPRGARAAAATGAPA